MVEKPGKENFNIPITKVSTGEIIKISETVLSLCSFKNPPMSLFQRFVRSPPHPQKGHKNHDVKYN